MGGSEGRSAEEKVPQAASPFQLAFFHSSAVPAPDLRPRPAHSSGLPWSTTARDSYARCIHGSVNQVQLAMAAARSGFAECRDIGSRVTSGLGHYSPCRYLCCPNSLKVGALDVCWTR